MGNIFLKKSYIKHGVEAIFLYVQVEIYQNILKLRCWSLTFTLYKVILKNKIRSGTSLPTPFSVWFLKKIISHAIFY